MIENEPIHIPATNVIDIPAPEPIVVGPSIFLRQEIASRRGVDTCVPTSIVNAAIGLSAITPDQAGIAYENIMTELLSQKDMWNGSFLRVTNSGDRRLMEIVERHLPVKIGYEYQKDKRLMIVPRKFDEVLAELSNGTAHVVLNDAAKHAFASIHPFSYYFVFIDPMDPGPYRIATREKFAALFNADNNGWVNAALISRR